MTQGSDRRHRRAFSHPEDDLDLDRRRGPPRRSHRRVPVSLWTEGTSRGRLDFHQSVNLSEGGMFIETDTPHPEGAEVTLEFTLPGGRDPIVAPARVVNTVTTPGQGGPSRGNGVEFVGLSGPDLARIRQFIRQSGS